MNWIDGGFNRYMATPINLIHVDVDGFSLGVPPVDQSELGGFFSHQKTGIPNDAGMTRTTVPGLLTKKRIVGEKSSSDLLTIYHPNHPLVMDIIGC